RMHRQRGRDRDALPFPARQGVDSAAPERVDADLVDHFLDTLPHQRPRQPKVLETKGELGLDVLEDELRVWMLKDEADVRPELTWRMRPGVEAADDHPAAEVPTGVVRDQAVQAAKQGRLSTARGAADQDRLARLD